MSWTESHGHGSLAGYSPWRRKVGHDLASKLPPECPPPYPHFHPTLGFLLLGLWFSSKRHLRLLPQGEVAVCLGHSDLRVGVLVCECYHHCPLDRMLEKMPCFWRPRCRWGLGQGSLSQEHAQNTGGLMHLNTLVQGSSGWHTHHPHRHRLGHVLHTPQCSNLSHWVPHTPVWISSGSLTPVKQSF